MPNFPVPHNRPTFDEAEVQAVVAVLRSGRWTAGPVLAQAEATMAGRLGRQYGVGVSSGLAALRLALLGLGIGPGDEVLVPAYSCVAIANAVLATGAKPVPADVAAPSWNIDLASARQALTGNSRAVVAVNTFGVPSDIPALKTLGLPIIEDASHGFALGSRGEPIVSGDLVVLSCYATKLIGAGQGGMILTDDIALADRVRDRRDCADKPPSPDRLNDQMTDLEAALLRVQLDRLDAMLADRLVRAGAYDAALSELAITGSLELPEISPSRSWYRYAIVALGWTAAELVEELGSRGVLAAVPVEDWISEWPDRQHPIADYPVAARAFRDILSIPLYPTLGPAEQERVCMALTDLLRASPEPLH